jgi:anti-anti-sigma factor
MPAGLAIDGEIDEDTYPALVHQLDEAAQDRDEVQIDLSAVEYCDLAGLRAIIRLATADRKLILHGVPAHLLNLLSILGWDQTSSLVINPGTPAPSEAAPAGFP